MSIRSYVATKQTHQSSTAIKHETTRGSLLDTPDNLCIEKIDFHRNGGLKAAACISQRARVCAAWLFYLETSPHCPVLSGALAFPP